MNSNLASVHSDEEYQLIQKVVLVASHGSGPTWIGGSDAQKVYSYCSIVQTEKSKQRLSCNEQLHIKLSFCAAHRITQILGVLCRYKWFLNNTHFAWKNNLCCSNIACVCVLWVERSVTLCLILNSDEPRSWIILFSGSPCCGNSCLVIYNQWKTGDQLFSHRGYKYSAVLAWL